MTKTWMAAAIAALAIPFGASAVEITDANNYHTYGNANSYLGSGITGAPSSPGQIRDNISVYAASGGSYANGPVGGTGTIAGIDAPVTGTSGNTPFRSFDWSANVASLDQALSGNSPLFLFGFAEPGSGHALAVWASITLVDSAGTVYQHPLYMTNDMAAYGAYAGIAQPTGMNALATYSDRRVGTFAGTDLVAVPTDVPGNIAQGQNAFLFAVDVPLLNQWIDALVAQGSAGDYTMNMNVQFGCPSDWTGNCDPLSIGGGSERIILAQNTTPSTPNPVPEPAGLALVGAALAGLVIARRRRA